MTCRYDRQITEKVVKYLDPGQQVFWKAYVVVDYAGKIRPIYFSQAPVICDEQNCVVSDRPVSYASYANLNLLYETRNISGFADIERGIHVFLNRHDAEIDLKLSVSFGICVPVFASKEDLVGAGRLATSTTSIAAPVETAVFMKVKLEKRALLNALKEKLGKDKGIIIRQIMRNTFPVKKQTPELVGAS